jgi:hypothetical protein
MTNGKSVLERLSEAHGRELKGAIEGGYDSDTIFIDARLEIERLRGEVERLQSESYRYREALGKLTNGYKYSAEVVQIAGAALSSPIEPIPNTTMEKT